MKKFLIASFLIATSFFVLDFRINGQIPFPGGGSGGGAGTSVAILGPYLTVNAIKSVTATGFPFTAFFSGSFLDAVTSTLTAETDGSELISSALNNNNSWYSVAATTSIEAEITGIASDFTATTSLTTGSPTVGIWICDTTNSKVYNVEITNNSGAAVEHIFQVVSWTLASCAGTPSAATVLVVAPMLTNGIIHLKMAKVGGNLVTSVGTTPNNLVQIDTRAVGTISKAGIDLRQGAAVATTISMTVLSVAVI